MFDYGLTLKSGELFFASNTQSDGNQESAAGLYFRDTRFLSEFSVALNGSPLEMLAVKSSNLDRTLVYLTNPAIADAHGERIPGHQLSVIASIELSDRLTATFTVHNYHPGSFSGTLAVALDADFRDLFDVRGFRRDARGVRLPVETTHLPMYFGYRGVDGVPASTSIDVSDRGSANVRLGEGMRATIEIELDIPAGAEALHTITIIPAAPEQRNRVSASAVTPSAKIHTGHNVLDAVLAQAARDLEGLDTPFAQGTMPAAGIPWFVAPFGRDSLIVGLQTLHLRPASALGTLQVLASLQGAKEDPMTDEQPGKILHEVRYGEMARTMEIPHRPYYGTVDATPLFAWLVAEASMWTGDEQVWNTFKPHAVRALEWIETYGDVDGDGLIEYPTSTQSSAHISHKVWKDSWDSLHYPDGRPGSGLIAAVEVQGYVYAAYTRLADAAERFGDASWAASLRERAGRVRAEVEEKFWLEADGFYAQALDSDKQPIGAISSNPGHLLFAGLPSAERAARMAARLVSPEMSSGWGIRTLSTSMASYNPMSYHNGSVWPHDNSLIAAGLYRYGLREAAETIVTGLLRAAEFDPDWRLPELYCGYPRTGDVHERPVAYPVSCNPQAWASGAFPLIIRAMLGLHVASETPVLRIDPQLPDWLDAVTISDLHVLGANGSISVSRSEHSFDIVANGVTISKRGA